NPAQGCVEGNEPPALSRTNVEVASEIVDLVDEHDGRKARDAPIASHQSFDLRLGHQSCARPGAPRTSNAARHSEPRLGEYVEAEPPASSKNATRGSWPAMISENATRARGAPGWPRCRRPSPKTASGDAPRGLVCRRRRQWVYTKDTSV